MLTRSNFTNSTRLLICAIFVLFIQEHALAAPSLDDLKALYPKIDNELWNYTATVNDDIGLRTERFENGNWELISFNNKAPGSEEDKRYQEYLYDAEEQEARNNPVQMLPNLLDSLTVLNVIDENDETVIYRVPPEDLNSDEGDDTHKYLEAEMTFSKLQNAITTIRLKNIKQFRPIAILRVIDFQIELQFSTGTNSIPKGFLIEERQNIKAKAMGLKNIDQNDISTYSEFTKVGIIPVEANNGIGDGAQPIPD